MHSRKKEKRKKENAFQKKRKRSWTVYKPAIWQAACNLRILRWPVKDRPEPLYKSEYRIKHTEYILWSNKQINEIDWISSPVIEWIDGWDYMPAGRVFMRRRLDKAHVPAYRCMYGRAYS